MIDKPVVDWEPFHKYSEQTITCQCGAEYRTHFKLTTVNGQFLGVTEKPCPTCGSEFGHVKAARSDPERWTL